MPDFVSRSYEVHRASFESTLTDPLRMKIAETWLDYAYLANVYEWRLGYELGELFGSRSVVTIGDGRGGIDAIKLTERGATDVLPTDISPFLLEKARAEGRISRFSVENAEKLSFSDAAFDFAFVKETLHHLPRPWLGLYEMLRVARLGVALVEPQDQTRTPYEVLRRLKSKAIPGEYESGGNFVFRVSLEELYRVGLAMNLPAVAHRYETFATIDGSDFIKTDERSARALKWKLKRGLRRVMAVIRLIRPMILLAVVLKEPPKPEDVAWFETNGWKLKYLQSNPHWR